MGLRIDMSLFKCKMCGGTIEFEQGATVGVCDSCGTKQTLPKLTDERKANLYDRANHFRRNNDFDKAASIYEQILNEDLTDAESYWSLVLCRYGIEYVEDPVTHKRVPTVNRAQFTSIFDDDNYKSAIANADGNQKSIYESEAYVINEIQKGIIEVSQKEEPFDVFICYKESDNNGRRTQDSVLANELYHQLIQEGFKVFFSRITLEDKLGTEYEPYIFAALNSAKVMVVLGTKTEYFNAVWVKNEWSRFLALVKNSNGKKILIPAYRDMDPYDLPEEFSHLQAQDMSKLGFMQDLIRGIKKIIAVDDAKTMVKETVVVNAGNGDIAPILKRAFLYLEDGEWESADEYAERALDMDPENAQAYVVKLLIDTKCKTIDDIKDVLQPFADNGNYRKAVRFGDDKLKKYLQESNEYIIKRNEDNRCRSTYDAALAMLDSARIEDDYLEAAEKFASIGDYKDAKDKEALCREYAENAYNNIIYERAIQLFKVDDIVSVEKAKVQFQKISGWKDADQMVEACDKRLPELRVIADSILEEERLIREKKYKRVKWIFCGVILFLLLVAGYFEYLKPYLEYKQAEKYVANGQYDEAIEKYETLNDYRDSADRVEECKEIVLEKKYMYAIGMMDAGDYEGAIANLESLKGYKNSDELIENAKRENKIEKIKKSSIGSHVKWDKYDDDWIVIDKTDNKTLLLSNMCVIDYMYDFYNGERAWETSSIREWLNTSYYENWFDDYEKELIKEVVVDCGDYETKDKAFILSRDEIDKYLTNNISIGESWWYRNSMVINKASHQYVGFVGNNGTFERFEVSHESLSIPSLAKGVRPAVYIITE